MTSYYQLLRRRPEPGPSYPAGSPTERSTDEISDRNDETTRPDQPAPPPEQATPAKDYASTPGKSLTPPPRLEGIPSNWLPQIDRIAMHLLAQEEVDCGICLLFVGIAHAVGATTIAYLVAHHLASDTSGTRTLFVECSPEPERPPAAGSHGLMRIGESVPHEIWQAPRALTLLSVRPGETLAIRERTSWFRGFVQQARHHFDQVIIDAPPFPRSPMTYVIAKAVDSVVLVLKSGEARYPAVNTLVAELETLGIPVKGTVLNFREYPLPAWLIRYL